MRKMQAHSNRWQIDSSRPARREQQLCQVVGVVYQQDQYESLLIFLALHINVPVILQKDEQETVIKPCVYLIGDLNPAVFLQKKFAGKAMPLLAPQIEAHEKIAMHLDKGIPDMEASKKY